METAISGRSPLSPNPLLNIKPDKSFLYRAACANRGMVVAFSAMAPSGKGVTVLDRPVKEKTIPERDSDKDTDKSFLYRAACANRGMLVAFSAMAPSGKGGGLLCQAATVKERPIPKQKTYKDLRKSKKHSPPYRVLLHNDNFNRREYVVQVLMKVISGMTVDTAINIMQVAHINGLAVVISCGQADAEHYCMRLRENGLLSSIEPASDGC